MSAVTGGDHESFSFRVGRDPEVSIMRFAIHTHARINNWRIGELGKCP
jgi:hypothetical protein